MVPKNSYVAMHLTTFLTSSCYFTKLLAHVYCQIRQIQFPTQGTKLSNVCFSKFRNLVNVGNNHSHSNVEVANEIDRSSLKKLQRTRRPRIGTSVPSQW